MQCDVLADLIWFSCGMKRRVVQFGKHSDSTASMRRRAHCVWSIVNSREMQQVSHPSPPTSVPVCPHVSTDSAPFFTFPPHAVCKTCVLVIVRNYRLCGDQPKMLLASLQQTFQSISEHLQKVAPPPPCNFDCLRCDFPMFSSFLKKKTQLLSGLLFPLTVTHITTAREATHILRDPLRDSWESDSTLNSGKHHSSSLQLSS